MVNSMIDQAASNRVKNDCSDIHSSSSSWIADLIAKRRESPEPFSRKSCFHTGWSSSPRRMIFLRPFVGTISPAAAPDPGAALRRGGPYSKALGAQSSSSSPTSSKPFPRSPVGSESAAFSEGVCGCGRLSIEQQIELLCSSRSLGGLSPSGNSDGKIRPPPYLPAEGDSLTFTDKFQVMTNLVWTFGWPTMCGSLDVWIHRSSRH